MKRIILLALFLITALGTFAQYCIPSTAVPYASTQPGITRFVLNTIDRSSADIENYPNNSYVNTGLTTALEAGNTYTVRIDYTLDALISPDMNLRVWIDYNQDYQLDDAGETAVSVDHVSSLSWTGTLTVPANAMSGPTRMRVTAKMTDLGGHSLPTPCDDPPDWLGYHGEFEDYTVEISSPVSVPELTTGNFSVSCQPGNNSIRVSYKSNSPEKINVMLTELTGRVVFNDSFLTVAGEGDYTFENSNLAKGLYQIILSDGKNVYSQKLFAGSN